MIEAARKVLLLLTIGIFICAQQISAQSIFEQEGEDLSLDRFVIAPPVFSEGPAIAFHSFDPDTLETYDIEFEEDEGTGLYKEIAVFVIVAAMVGYMVVQLIRPGEEEESENGKGGKDVSPPSASIPLGFTAKR